MNHRTFKSVNGLELVVKNRKSAVIFETAQNQAKKNYKFSFQFTSEDFHKLFQHIEAIASSSWTNLTPKEADSLGVDYFEYYDRELDNNGYLAIKQNTLYMERPSLESERLYQFNKRKMETFLFDFKKLFVLNTNE